MKTLLELTRDSLLSVVFHLAPRFASALLFIFIGRFTGPAEAGVFALATSYLLIFTTVMRGLDDLTIRQVSREPDQASRYFTNFLLARTGLSVLLYGVLVFTVLVIFDYAASTSASILVLASSMIPDSVTYVAQSILLGQRRFGAPAITWSSASLFKLMAGGLVLAGGGGLYQIAWIWLAGSLLGMIMLLTAVVKGVGGLRRADWLDWRPLARNWRGALSFLYITTIMALESQSDTVMLSAFHGEAEVGWYGAATTVAFGLLMFSQAYRFSVYPLMARYALHAPENLSRLYERSVQYIGALILPAASGIVLLSPQIVSLLFGLEFQPAVQALRILILALVFFFLNEPNVRMMLVRDGQRWVSIFLTISALTNVLLNWVLIPSGGALGAAVARLCSSLVFFLLNYYYVSHFFVRLNIIQLLYRPALATLIMTLAIWPLQAWALPVSIGIGIVMYTGSLWLIGWISPNDAMLLRRAVAVWLKARITRA